MKNLARKLISQLLSPVLNQLADHRQRTEDLLMLQAKLFRRSLVRDASENLRFPEDYEFKVFSQTGEDGIIQHLVANIEIPVRSFVEFGVQDYQESNTRYLLKNDRWKGLIIDGDPVNLAKIRADATYYMHDLEAIASFVTRENIDDLIRRAGLKGDIGLLSIDIDGNDYWVWERITTIQPRIVIVEYNSTFGAQAEVTVPYTPDFFRGRAHYSHLYYGASLAALHSLGAQKGYDLVGVNSYGNNAFFVRRDCGHPFEALSAARAFRACPARESRDQAGRLSFAGGQDKLALIQHLPVVNVATGETVLLSDLIKSGLI
jgi:hypothetical protein